MAVTHKMTGTRLYRTYKDMKARCKRVYTSERRGWECYKKKKIKLCKEWQLSDNFLKWAIDNGYKEDLVLDRIDNSKGYSPDNCRWVTPKENANNKDNTIYLEFNGQNMPISMWAEKLKVPRDRLYRRYRRGMPIEKILSIEKLGA